MCQEGMRLDANQITATIFDIKIWRTHGHMDTWLMSHIFLPSTHHWHCFNFPLPTNCARVEQRVVDAAHLPQVRLQQAAGPVPGLDAAGLQQTHSHQSGLRQLAQVWLWCGAMVVALNAVTASACPTRRRCVRISPGRGADVAWGGMV